MFYKGNDAINITVTTAKIIPFDNKKILLYVLKAGVF